MTVMKLHFPKQKPKIICYQDYKNLRNDHNEIFRAEKLIYVEVNTNIK